MRFPNVPKPSDRTVRIAWGLVVMVALALLLWLVATVVDQTDRLDTSFAAIEDLAASQAAQEAALEEANRRLERAGKPPVEPPPTAAPDLDLGEIQEPEIQEREIQDPEIPDPEADDPERQDAESDDPELQQGEVQDGEVQDSEQDDPEIQDPEIQDEEKDDPDPDDPEQDDPDPFAEFHIADNCNPAEGEHVTDVGLSWDSESATLTLTCSTAPDFPGQP